MSMEMTKEWLLERCKAQGLYRTPNLNNSLYLQCQAFREIQNLDEYTGVKQLHLEENCIESLNGVQPLKQLQCLYLHKNFVRAIDHLEELEDLDTLDFRILDLSHNKLKDGDGVLGVAKSLANLAVLYLSGNPFVAVFPHYRKKLIGTLEKLNHLDDRPVFWDERRYAEAWMRGGQEEESRERDRVLEMRATEETLQFDAMRQLRSQAMEERQYVVHSPILQFTPEELGDNVEALRSPTPEKTDHASLRKIEVQDGGNVPFEETGVRILAFPFAKVGVSLTEGGGQGQERGGWSTSYSKVEADYSIEHDLMLVEDQHQQWEANCSMNRDSMPAQDTNQQWGTEHSLERDSMVAQDIHQQWEADYSVEHSRLARDQTQQSHTQRLTERGSTVYSQGENERSSTIRWSQSTDEKHAEFCTTSQKSEPNSMQHERILQTENKRRPAACSSMLQDLGAICLPAWESRSQVLSDLLVEDTTKGNTDHPEVKPSVDTCQACEPTDKQGASSPSPQEVGINSLEWNRFYDNPSFYSEQQYDDNFLLALQAMNHIEPIATREH